MLQWLNDTYAVNAVDVAAAWAGRGYNAGKGRWETVSGIDLSGSSVFKRHTLRSCDIRVQTAAGNVKDGVFIVGFVIMDPQNTGMVYPWFQGVQSKGRLVTWAGEIPMAAGFVWRIHQSALIDTDVVSLGVGYE
jgi:hypothetical protein